VIAVAALPDLSESEKEREHGKRLGQHAKALKKADRPVTNANDVVAKANERKEGRYAAATLYEDGLVGLGMFALAAPKRKQHTVDTRELAAQRAAGIKQAGEVLAAAPSGQSQARR
jgi:hypothetical protein